MLIQYSLNFSSVLLTKHWIPIYDGSVWKGPVIPAELTDIYHLQGMLCADGAFDSDLVAVFHSLQYTTILFNKHYYEQTPIDGTLLQECLGFVHSSLIKLDGQLEDKLSECLRLGMMAFFATTFRLPGLYEHPCCKSLANQLQLSYAAVKALTPDFQETIDTWLMLVCLITNDNINELHIWPSWKAIAIRGPSWNKIREKLKQVMWIDAFHDDLGRRAFEALMIRFEPANSSGSDSVVL
jgi:hypothetical protein